MGMQTLDNYPGLKKAALEIAYDNGMINRNCTEEQYTRSTDPIIGAESVYDEDLKIWSDWIDNLNDEDLSTLCCGESCEMEEIISKAPKAEFLDGLLNDLFDI